MKKSWVEAVKEFDKQLCEINNVPCIKCNSIKVGVALQKFKNNTVHLYTKCFDCRNQWYLSKDVEIDITKLKVITTLREKKVLKQKERALKENLMELILGN